MKMKKLLTVVAAFFAFSASTFAFDASTFWKEYGGPLKDGDGLFNVGVGIPQTVFLARPGSVYIPSIETSYEKMVLINDTLPLSFGGYGAANILYWNDAAIGDTFFLWSSVGALAKWHFNFDLDKLDVYAGLKVGFGYNMATRNGEPVSGYIPFSFDYGTFIGATWFFTKSFGLTAEVGYKNLIGVKASFRM